MGKKKVTSNALEIMHALFDGDNPETQEFLRKEREKIDIAQQIYDMRKSARLTQKQLASMINTSPSVISRLEDADYEGHSVSMLKKIARALGYRLSLSFEDIEEGRKYNSDITISTSFKSDEGSQTDLNWEFMIFEQSHEFSLRILPGEFVTNERQSDANQLIAA